MADAGLCLHQSSSGLDLPMKLSDFRGVGVPVCAYDYAPVLSEAITPGREGVTFRDPGELSAVLLALAAGDLSSVPKFAASRVWLAANLAQLGRLDEARAEAAEVLRIDPKYTIDGTQMRLAHYKRPEDAEHLFDGLRKAGLPER